MKSKDYEDQVKDLKEQLEETHCKLIEKISQVRIILDPIKPKES